MTNNDRMGFPSHAGRGEGEAGLGMCMCHMDTGGGKISSSGYICPQCQARWDYIIFIAKKKILVAELQMKPFFMALMMKCTDN